MRDLAHELIRKHLDARWQFRFDRAKTRAGLCNYTTHTISVSRYLLPRMSEHEAKQVLLHEIAHAQAGHAAGHGQAWLTAARAIGYRGARTHSGQAATEFARWLGVCPNGHEVLRFRRPSRAMSCARCAPRFDAALQLRWRQRTDAELAAAARATT